MKKLKYIIVAPICCRTGGSVAMRALCKYLNDIGEDARMYYTSFFWKEKNIIKKMRSGVLKVLKFNIAKFSKRFREKYAISKDLNCRQKYFPVFDKNTVVIYHQETYGNVLNGPYIVRWFLYHNQILKKDGDKTVNYDKNDLFLCY